MIKMENDNKGNVILALHQESILTACEGICKMGGYGVNVYEGDAPEGILELYKKIKPNFLFMDLNFKEYIPTVEPAEIVYDGLKEDVKKGLVCYLGISGNTIIKEARKKGIPAMSNTQFIESLIKILNKKSLQGILETEDVKIE
ncbi:MAG: hypothetical protein KJ674_01150 [Nanoarchaeota archaeon]|nr:hypothetical protein [Nanoarchaeota archaeon]